MSADHWETLDALAAAATPGPWQYYSTVHADAKVVGQSGHWPADEIASVSNAPEDYGHADAAYIAAASPDVVRRLIADLREQRESLGGMVEWLAEVVCDAREMLVESRRQYVGDLRGSRPVGKVPVDVAAVLAILDRERNANPSRYDAEKARADAAEQAIARLTAQSAETVKAWEAEVAAISESHIEWERKANTYRAECDRLVLMMDGWDAMRDATVAERDAARAAIARVRALHTRGAVEYVMPSSGDRFRECDGCGDEYPCPTIRALATPDDPADGRHSK